MLARDVPCCPSTKGLRSVTFGAVHAREEGAWQLWYLWLPLRERAVFWHHPSPTPMLLVAARTAAALSPV